MDPLINENDQKNSGDFRHRLKELEKQIAFYERILREVPAAIYISEVNRNIVWCNHTFEQLSGYTLNEIRARGDTLHTDLVHPDDMRIRDEQIVHYRNFFGMNFGGVYRIRHKLDRVYRSLVSWTKSFDTDEQGNPQTVLSIDMDINKLSPLHEKLTAAFKDGVRLRNEGLAESLTQREKEILKLICNGKNNREISEKLFVSLYTIDTHRKNIRRKLHAHNSAELTKKAREIGLD
ncbi:MAG: PAS domain-containing protein [Mucilaginibacter polytrichastri]|nr:PAS domain-containing protein [Mucilaginibacter polytrichastri]